MSRNPGRKIRRARQRAAAAEEHYAATSKTPEAAVMASGVLHGVCRDCGRRRLLVAAYRLCERCYKGLSTRILAELDIAFPED